MNNITATILLTASIGLFFGYINPAYSSVVEGAALSDRSVKELMDVRGRYSDAIEKTREIETARTGLLEKYNAIPQADKDKLEKILPDYIDSVRLIIDINNIAAGYGITLKNITLDDTKSGSEGASAGVNAGRYESVNLRFGISGSYDDFRSFIGDLERSLRLADINSINFAAANDAALPYDFSVTVATYRLK